MPPEKICPQCGGSFGPEERFCPKDGTALRPSGAADSLIGQVIADRYQIIAMLGEGGMGRVYLAEHVRMGRKSAVKVLSPNLALAADAISRFNREAANASRINHPNVAQIYDFGETDDGLLYLAMEFVEGETLSAIIKREGALPLRRAADLIKQTSDALGAAHHMGIVHRDLKPDNIMVARHHDGSDWVKVVDFGIAKTVQGSGGEGGSQTVTTAGVSIGTPEYMSPEQLAGDKLDNRTDLYSLGLVLFNMLTGDLPYPRVTSRDTLVRRLTTRPMTLHEVVPARSWPPALQVALDRALAPDAAERYASVTEFGRDVMLASEDIGGVDRTIPVESVPRPPRESAPVAPALATTAIPASAVPRQTTPPAKSRRSLLAAVGALVVVGGGAAYVMSRGTPGPASSGAGNPPVVAIGDTAHHGVDSTSRVAAATDSARPAAVASKKSNDKIDTIVKAAKPSPAAKAAADSAATTKPAEPAPAPPPTPVTSALAAPETTVAARGKKAAQFRHAWLGATGDSAKGAGAATTDEDKIRVIAGDIQGHLVRAQGFVKQGDIPKARAEYREAIPVVGVLRQLYSGNPGELRVEQMLRQGFVQTMATCRATVADSTLSPKLPVGFRCEGLMPPAIRAQGRARGGNTPFR